MEILWILVPGALVICAILIALIIRRPKTEEAPQAPPPVRYKVTLYNNGEVVRTIRATYAYATEGGGYAHAEGDNESTMFGGCFVIEPIDGPATTPRTPASKHKVTLFDGGKIVREWYSTYSYGTKGGAYLHTEGASDSTMIAGTFLVEPIT